MAAEVALGFAADHSDSLMSTVWWVPLVAVRDPGILPSVVAGALRLMPSGAVPVEDLLVRRLSEDSTLLVLDNCEQVAAACVALVSVLLARCTRLRVLTTSRIPLGLSGEHVFSVPPMTSSMRVSHRVGSDAVELFVRRALLVAPSGSSSSDDPAIAEICDRLAGLRLAIEFGRRLDSSAVDERSLGRDRLTQLRTLADASVIQRLPDTTTDTRFGVHEFVRAYALLGSELTDLPDRHQNMTVLLDSTWRSLDVKGHRDLTTGGRET